MSILKVNQSINNYTVHSSIKIGLYYETCCAVDQAGAKFFMKVFDLSKVPDVLLDSQSEIIEIALSRKINSSNVISWVDNGIFEISGIKYPYCVYRYFPEIYVANSLVRGRLFPLELALQIIKETLKGLVYLHSIGLIHNNISPWTIVYNHKKIHETALIGLDNISEAGNKCNGVFHSDESLLYCSLESLNGNPDYISDIYSVVAVLYSMLFGYNKWKQSLSDYKCETDDDITFKVVDAKHLLFSGSLEGCPLWLQKVFRVCLRIDKKDRIQSAQELLNIFETELFDLDDPVDNDKKVEVRTSHCSKSDDNSDCGYRINKKIGRGFADVAGMDDIKALLQQKVIFILKNPEQARKYKLTPPNGMLLYGPPGCGKTFFAEKFAEEAALNYICIKGSDVGSTYIHGSQGKIAQLFKDAERNAPSVICFDEFDAMVPKRSGGEAQSLMNPEVNEFLSQLNNCSERGIFVIGTTNHKELIDEAILRKGRMDFQVFIPAPDVETRKKIFDLYLKDRPCSDIDTNVLAKMTDNYSSSDIAFIVNDAALIAAYKDSPIEQNILEDSIRNNPSSLGQNNADFASRKKVGFNV